MASVSRISMITFFLALGGSMLTGFGVGMLIAAIAALVTGIAMICGG